MNVKQRGFTLIEIMIAMVILSIIATVAIQYYEGYIGEARIGTAIQDIREAELILDDLASDENLEALDNDSGTELGLYLSSGTLTLSNPTVTPAGAVPWLDPWDNIYRYRRNTGTNSGTRNDGGGNVSNNAANSPWSQSYDLFSQGPNASDASDDVVRGCNGSFVGVDADHPSC